MGVSTDAILFYGILIPEDTECPWEVERDGDSISWLSWDDHWVKLQGVAHPSIPWSKDEETAAVFNAYWDAKHQAEKLSLCEIRSHCCSDDPMYYVALKELHFSASRGSAHTFEGNILPEASLQASIDVMDWCRKMGIVVPEDQQPEWHLVSDWS